MKIAMLAESLGSGGAERQICQIAAALKKRAHEVRLATYAEGDFFKGFLKENNVPHDYIGGIGSKDWAVRIRKYLRKEDVDVVLTAHLATAGYAELSAIPFKPWGLVVREGLAVPSGQSRFLRFRRYLHTIADRVITNSHENTRMVLKNAPWLRRRTHTIYNAVELELFRPFDCFAKTDNLFRMLVVARMCIQKNVFGTIKALSILKKNGLKVTVDWFGSDNGDQSFVSKLRNALLKESLDEYFHYHHASSDIVREYQQADAVLLPSFYEGLPNAVCEGMACGKPIIASRVGDIENLVVERENGFLFDPASPESIAGSIASCANLSSRERKEMGRQSRKLAEKYFPIEKITDKYEEVLLAAANHTRRRIEDWPRFKADAR